MCVCLRLPPVPSKRNTFNLWWRICNPFDKVFLSISSSQDSSLRPVRETFVFIIFIICCIPQFCCTYFDNYWGGGVGD